MDKLMLGEKSLGVLEKNDVSLRAIKKSKQKDALFWDIPRNIFQFALFLASPICGITH